LELTELLASVTDSFSRHRIPFLVVGGVAVSMWVEPRLTRDVDVVVLVPKRHRSRLKQALIDAGARPTELEMRILFEKKWVRLTTAGPRLDVHLAASKHDREAFKNTVVTQVADRKVPLACVEDLILYKLAAGRPHDLVDVESLIRGIRDVDRGYLEARLDAIGEQYAAPVRERWRAALLRAKGNG
jgi:hypothetical protein